MYVLSNFQGLKKFADDSFVLNLQKKDSLSKFHWNAELPWSD